MSKAIRIHAHGGPDQMLWEEVKVGKPGTGQVLLRHSAVGLNFIDVYHRTGLYPLPALPGSLGMEAAGVVVEIGPDVSEVDVGDRVAYAMGVPGSYCEERIYPASRLVRLPDSIDERHAAAMMLQGMTAQYLLRTIHRVKAGETILIHAAAGGVGLIVCQWAKHLGATVIGTVSTPEKAAIAKAHGCDHPIITSQSNFVEQVRAITKGQGVPVVYDSIGKDSFYGSLDCLQPRGMMVSFGQSSGSIGLVDIGILAAKGSLFLTRPSLGNYVATRQELVASAHDLFEVVQSGAVKIEINQTYSLADAAQAHRDLEARKTTGSTILLP